LLGDSFTTLSPPHPTLFTTLILRLELHPVKTSSVSHQASRRLCKRLTPANTDRLYDLRLAAVLPHTVQSPVDDNKGLPTHSATRPRTSPLPPQWQAPQAVGNALFSGDKNG
jgi:hypothetical protein